MTNGNNFNSRSFPTRILIAPLDWGLGHATRCIPIIKYLLCLKVDVVIAASGNSFFLLKKEFPELKIFLISGYKIRYSRKKRNLPFKLLLQFPKLLISILGEHYWLKKFIRTNRVDAVISDNRFGMYYKKITSIYITHQLLIKTGNPFTERLAQRLHYFFIKKFNTCWIPDYAEDGLAGILSHPKNVPGNVEYIGPLSRFEKINDVKKVRDVVIIISGPEPQRQILEEKIISQLHDGNKKILLVRGLANETKILQTDDVMIEIRNHLPAEEMNKAIQQSLFVIARSGYSTIMDLVKLGCPAAVIPTPGQTEQEYLGEYLMQKNIFYCITQDDFDITQTIENAKRFQFNQPDFPRDMYKNVLDEFVQSLKSGKFAAQ